jgi:DNA-binding ferritin-like protein (Dps family)
MKPYIELLILEGKEELYINGELVYEEGVIDGETMLEVLGHHLHTLIDTRVENNG